MALDVLACSSWGVKENRKLGLFLVYIYKRGVQLVVGPPSPVCCTNPHRSIANRVSLPPVDYLLSPIMMQFPFSRLQRDVAIARASVRLPSKRTVAVIAVAAPVGFLLVPPVTTAALGAIGFSSTGVVAGKQHA